ncbi:MAG: DUF6434 domain-containing protein [Pseudomonadota bacterium]
MTDIRPPVDRHMSPAEFGRWYWPVEHLKQFCEALSLSKAGTKAELRSRVAYALGHDGAAPPPHRRTSLAGAFNWAKASLTRETVITDTISFGPNVRGFFKAEIGKAFVCNADFMAWVRANPGVCLGDAIDAWSLLEARKADPSFRREIAACNNYLQYLRDARDTFPALSLEAAKACWDYKKVRPAQNGIVVFEARDVHDAGCLSAPRAPGDAAPV